MTLKWNGDAVRQAVEDASLHAIDRVMSDCVIEAKNNHPGWKNITGAAEGSVRIIKFAEKVGGRVRGLWGSVNVNYVIWLELKHGSFLRSAADRHYRKLSQYIREALKK